MKKSFFEFCQYTENDVKEKEEAIQYLKSWKKFFLRKLQKDTYNVILIEEKFIEKDASYSGVLCHHATIALQIFVSFKFKYDIENHECTE